jgi:hypothetical protein
MIKAYTRVSRTYYQETDSLSGIAVLLYCTKTPQSQTQHYLLAVKKDKFFIEKQTRSPGYEIHRKNSYKKDLDYTERAFFCIVRKVS